MVVFSQAFGALSVFIVLISLGIDILDLTVNGDDCRVVQFKEETQNTILANHVIRSEQLPGKDICELKCYLEPDCVSYNYGPLGDGAFICELSDKTHLQVSSNDLEHKDDYVYSPIVNSCESSPCPSNSTCQAGFGNHGYRCVCPDGYQGGQCQTDVDECTLNKHDCSSYGDCANVMGSYQCTCKTGFTGDGKTCQDVDECTTNKHDCSSDGDCANVMGSYQCTCNPGFTGDGKTCQDVDECALKKHNCSSDGGNCTNVIGSYRCTCKSGFIGETCQDIDECNDGSHDCHSAAICSNTAGSYGCSCKSGVLGDGHFCSDNWKKINSNPVCFGTKGDDYGPFFIQEAGQIYTFKLVHKSGSVTCDTAYSPSNWGCRRPQYGTRNLLTLITFSNRTVLPLAQFVKGGKSTYYTYRLEDANDNSPTLVFNLLPTPLVVSVGQQCQIWYGHDLIHYTEYNNDGVTCADVYGLYPLD